MKSHPLGPGLGKYALSPKLRPWLRKNGHKFDAWIINGLWQYQGLGASRIARELGIPYFVYAHGMLDPWSRRAHPFKYVKKLAYWLCAERATLNHANGVIFTSPEEAALAQSFFPTDGWNPITVGNGISDPPAISDRDTKTFRDDHNIDQSSEVWLFLSRIHPKKGIEILLEAMANGKLDMGNVTVAIAGNGSAGYIRSLKDLGARLGIGGKVKWLGPQYEMSKWRAFSAAQLFVLPSHQENFGIALVEALAMGLPVCTTRSVNIYEKIEECNAGLIGDDNEASFTDSLQRWQRLSKERREEMGKNARSCFESNFRIERATDRLLQAVTAAVEMSKSRRTKA